MKLRPHQIRERIPSLDLISMVDLVFLLIIFFLTTSTFIEKDKTKVTLPQESGEEFQEIGRSSVIVNLTRNGSLVISGETVELARCIQRIEAEIAILGGDPARLDLVLRADKDAPARALNELATALIALDVRGWKLATEAPLGGPNP